MRRSKAEIYIHLVWATRCREPLLTPAITPVASKWVVVEAKALGCEVLALNGTPDHLHLFVRMPTRVSVAHLAKQVKGVSSRELNNALPDGEGFGWQQGYGAFSDSRSHYPRVVAYVEGQQERHARGEVWPEWEQTDEELPD